MIILKLINLLQNQIVIQLINIIIKITIKIQEKQI